MSIYRNISPLIKLDLCILSSLMYYRKMIQKQKTKKEAENQTTPDAAQMVRTLNVLLRRKSVDLSPA